MHSVSTCGELAGGPRGLARVLHQTSSFSSHGSVFPLNFRTAYLLPISVSPFGCTKATQTPLVSKSSPHLSPQAVRHIFLPVSVNFTTVPPFAYDENLGLFLDFPSLLPTSVSQRDC